MLLLQVKRCANGASTFETSKILTVIPFLLVQIVDTKSKMIFDPKKSNPQVSFLNFSFSV